MTKHVFEFRFWGFSHMGEFVKETDKTITFLRRWGQQSRETRANKCNYHKILETDDPKAVKDAYDAEWARHDDAVKAARDIYHAALELQKSSALEAATVAPTHKPVRENETC